MIFRKSFSLVPLFVSLFTALGASAEVPSAWTTPFPAFRIAGNLYYVGSQDLASYLIVTPAGDILINSNLASSPPLIKKSVESLGFHWSDIRILLISHAHYDHCAGSAIDPAGYQAYIADRQQAFEAELKKQSGSH